MTNHGPKNSIAFKCLAGLLVGLLLAAIAGGFSLTREVAAMSARIDALTLTVQELNGRVLYLERAIRGSQKSNTFSHISP